MGFYNPLDYDENQFNWLLKELVYKYRDNADEYLEGKNLLFLEGEYDDALDFTKTDFYQVRREFLDFLSDDGTFSLGSAEYGIADFWDKEHQIALYKYRQSYLQEVLDVLDSNEFKKYLEDCDIS